MVRIALAPCSPFSVSPDLMRRTAELAERLDVRLHTHLAEDPDEDRFAARTFGRRTIDHFEDVGWLSRPQLGRALHLPQRRRGTPARRGGGRRRPLPVVEHADRWRRDGPGAPSSAPPALRSGSGCDGSASTDHASLWLEARTALLLGHQRKGPTGMTGA